MNYFSIILGKATIVTLVTGLLGFISMGVNIIVARTLHVDMYGLFSMFLAAGGMLGILMEGGIKHLIQRSVDNNLSFESLIVIQIKNIILINLIVLIFGLSFYKHFLIEVTITSLCFSCTAIYQCFSYYLKGRGKFSEDSLWNVANRILSASCIIFILYMFQNSITLLFMAWALPVFLIIILMSKFYAISYNWKAFPNFSNYKLLFPLLIIDIGLILSTKIDIIFMGIINFAATEVGYFAAGFKIIEIVIILAIPTSIVLFKPFKKEFEGSKKLPLFTIFSVLIGICIGISYYIIIYNFIDEIILLIYGNNYLGSSKYALDLAFLPILIIPNLIMFQAILATNNEHLYFKLLITSCLAHFLIIIIMNDNNTTYILDGIYMNQLITFLGSLMILVKSYIKIIKNHLL
ncbi:hypothetical protein OAM56_01775 [Alphaproteobacteria bacterium]|nr:hypothetical protein [Alphaproteobacteria bacterium]